MRFPGFTAEISLIVTRRSYWQQDAGRTGPAAAGTVQPQQFISFPAPSLPPITWCMGEWCCNEFGQCGRRPGGFGGGGNPIK